MTDRELLEWAAKAAGYQPDGRFGRGLLVVINAGQADQEAFAFDPLNDDGDALRLAVLRNMHVECNKHSIVASVNLTDYETAQPIYEYFDYESENGANKNAATRRAIVRAAAEIGKAMK